MKQEYDVTASCGPATAMIRTDWLPGIAPEPWVMTRHEAEAEFWAMLDESRRARTDTPTCPRYHELGVALQSSAWMADCMRVRGLSPIPAKRADRLRRIIEDIRAGLAAAVDADQKTFSDLC